MAASYLKSVEQKLNHFPVDRHQDLIDKLAEYIVSENKSGGKAQINFICTHNSRRSQFAQTWCTITQAYLELDVADAYSGGTEVTACNERTVAALKRAGLSIQKDGDDNPVYTVSDEDLKSKLKLWSKVYDDDANPKDNFAAVITCDHADQNCPLIPGAAARIPLTYTDPKYADDTDNESSAYDMACNIIATDTLRLFKKVKELM